MQGTGPKWAWLQLGLQYLDQGDAGQAIKALQHVIKADPNDKYTITHHYFTVFERLDIFDQFELCTVTAGNLWRMPT